MSYEREITLLAQELQRDDPSLTDAQARQLAREQMIELYRVALDWNRAAAAQRNVSTTAA